ncbi:MAG: gas vesicle protein [Paraglaciecola sp.]|jgi:gas vesicle protein
MNNDNKTFIGLALGLFAGAAAGYYLASDDGKKMRKQAKKQAKKLEAQARVALKEQSEVISTKMNAVANTAKTMVNDASTTAKSKLVTYRNEAEDVVEGAEGSFQQGINSAKAKMQAKADKITVIAEN